MIRILTVLLCFISANHSFAQVSQSLNDLFSYKKSTPFAFNVLKVEKYKDVSIQTATINNDKLQKIEIYLIEPGSKGEYPVVFYQHGGENDKTRFLREAKELSRKGFICVLVEAPWLRAVYKNNYLWANTAQFYRQGIIDIQRILDFLETKENVDVKRIAFIGHSYGAQLGGILSGIEPRFKAFVLMSGTSNLTELLKATENPQISQLRDSIPLSFNTWIEQMEPLNPINFIKQSSAPIFFQFATNDEYNIDEVEAKNYVSLAPVTEHVRFYNSKHQLINKKAEEDRKKWIIDKLTSK